MKTAFIAMAFAATALVSCAGGMYAPSAAGNTSLAITNLTAQAVWYINVRPCGTQDWGRDVLGTGVVTTGETVQRPVEPGCHDLRLRSDPSLHGEMVWSGVELAAGGTSVRSLGSWQPRQ